MQVPAVQVRRVFPTVPLRPYPSCSLPLVSFHSAFILHCSIGTETSYGQGNRNTIPGGSNSAFVTTSKTSRRTDPAVCKRRGREIPIEACRGPSRFLEPETPRIPRQSTHKVGKIFSSTHRPPLPPPQLPPLPGETSNTHFC